MTTYRVAASRGERYWLVNVPHVDQWTEGRDLDEGEPMARDLIAMWLEVPQDSFGIEVEGWTR